jgi:hypothetical protein
MRNPPRGISEKNKRFGDFCHHRVYERSLSPPGIEGEVKAVVINRHNLSNPHQARTDNKKSFTVL